MSVIRKINADIEQHQIVSSGEFTYEVIPFWAKFPKEFNGAEITASGCDSKDNVYVLTRDFNYPIIVFNKNGDYLYSFGKGVFIARPHGIFINKNDELYCTDDKAHVCMKFTCKGDLLQTYGTAGKPSDSGCNWNVYKEYRKANNIPDYAPNDGALDLKMRLDTIVRSAGPFNGPTKMIEAENGELFCSDGYGNASIHRFDHEGNLLFTFGAPGTEPGQFRLPHGIILDNAGRLWVADRENGRVQIFTQDGELVMDLEGITKAADLCSDGEYIYVSQTNGGGFHVFTQDAELVARIGHKNCPFYFHGISIDSEGSLYGSTLGKNKDYNIVKLQRVKK